MFGENKNLKDSLVNNPGITIKDTSLSISYTKTNKLVTALYMVTDMIDKDEPLRIKLRTLGTEIISDMNSTPFNVCGKISEIMSFLDIASAVNIISQMNCNILRKEFLELNQSIQQSSNKVGNINKQINLSEFFQEGFLQPENLNTQSTQRFQPKGHSKSIGHHNSTRIGVQKGSTLMKALSDRTLMSSLVSNRNTKPKNSDNFDLLKKQRREEIKSLIQKNGGNASITDIKNGAYGSLVSCSEKTLQRELISMVKDNVLNKTGEKRWSRYFINTTPP
jgi:hypothetical protein